MKNLTFLLFFVCSIASAQFISVPSAPIHTPYGNVPMTRQIYMPTHYYGNVQTNPKLEFEVTFKNDSTAKIKSRILVENKKMYVTAKEKKKIFPSDTKYMMYYPLGKTVIGLPADSCWLFLVKIGPIKCFSSAPYGDENNAIAIQKGNEGNIVALNKTNLKEMLATEDEKILHWIEKDQLGKAIRRFNQLAVKKK